MKRILSIDGGGIKGVFPAAFLADLEEGLDRPIGEYFDLIVGTSTGGIIALGLASGLEAGEILDLYVNEGPEIFPRPPTGRRWFAAKFDPGPLQRSLQRRFGDRKIRDCTRRVVVPSQLLETGEVHLYKTRHHPDVQKDPAKTLVEVALATSAAPTYFPPSRGAGGAAYVDGGTWANNPAAVAAVEARGKLEWSKGEARMLSLGCTTEPLSTARFAGGTPGIIRWVFGMRALKIIQEGQSSGAQGMAELLLGAENVHRYSPVVYPGQYALDDVSGIGGLRGLGHTEARKAIPTLQPLFFTEPAKRFEPLP